MACQRSISPVMRVHSAALYGPHSWPFIWLHNPGAPQQIETLQLKIQPDQAGSNTLELYWQFEFKDLCTS